MATRCRSWTRLTQRRTRQVVIIISLLPLLYKQFDLSIKSSTSGGGNISSCFRLITAPCAILSLLAENRRALKHFSLEHIQLESIELMGWTHGRSAKVKKTRAASVISSLIFFAACIYYFPKQWKAYFLNAALTRKNFYYLLVLHCNTVFCHESAAGARRSSHSGVGEGVSERNASVSTCWLNSAANSCQQEPCS